MVETPKFFIIMPAKTGSTAMHYMLSQHPEICVSDPKELAFFNKQNWSDIKDNPEKYRKKYLDHWNKNQSGIPVDITPAYCTKKSINKILLMYKDAKFVFFTRNPYERAISHMIFRRAKQEIAHNKKLNKKFTNIIDDVFEEQWLRSLSNNKSMPRFKFDLPNKNNMDDWLSVVWNNYIEKGLYAAKIQHLFNKVGKKNILVLTHEQLVKDHQDVLNKMFNFLDLSSIKIDNFYTNEGKFWKQFYDASSELTEEHKAYLKGCFAVSNKHLLSLTGINYL